MNEFYVYDPKYTCRACMKISDDLSTMTPKEINTYQNYVLTESSNTIMKICFVCRYMIKKFTRFMQQCQKISKLMCGALEENQMFSLETKLAQHNYVVTRAYTQYIGPEIEFEISDNNYDQLDDHRFDDGDELPLVMLKDDKDDVKFEVTRKDKRKKKRKWENGNKDYQIRQNKVKKTKKELKEGFTSRMVQETDEYEVIKLTKEQVLKEMEEKSTSEKYTRSVFKCESCVKGFNFKDVLENHMKRHSPSHGSLKCEICAQYCPSVVSLRGHMKSHTTRYKCKVCGSVRLSRQHLLEHHALQHTCSATPYSCNQCSFTTTKRTVIQRHVKSHKAARKYSCDVCGSSFNSMNTLRGHIARHDASKIFNCEKCNAKFIYPSTLQKHMHSVHENKDYYCVECDVTFKNLDNLKLHFKRAKIHRDPSTFKYQCTKCDQRFISQSSLDVHSTASHGAAKKHACALCGRLYSSSDALNTHKRRIHSARIDVRPSCDICRRNFSRKSVLVKHMRTHTGERPYCCECGAAFAHQATLRAHQASRHKKHDEIVSNGI